MPGRLTVAERADRLAFAVEHVGDDVHLRVPRRRFAAGALVRRRIERAEVPREREQVIVAEVLVAKEQHIVAVPRALDRFDLGLRDAREVDAAHLGADEAQRSHFKLLNSCHLSLSRDRRCDLLTILQRPAALIAKDLKGEEKLRQVAVSDANARRYYGPFLQQTTRRGKQSWPTWFLCCAF